MFHSSPGSRWLSNDAPIACGVDESTPSWSTKENVSDIPYNFKQDRRYLIDFWKLFIHDCLKLLERGKKSAQISKKKKCHTSCWIWIRNRISTHERTLSDDFYETLKELQKKASSCLVVLNFLTIISRFSEFFTMPRNPFRGYFKSGIILILVTAVKIV